MAHVIQWLGHSLSRILPSCNFLYMVEEVSLTRVRERHLPAGRKRQLIRHVVRLLAEVGMLLSRGRGGSSPSAQLQGSWRRVRADVVDPDGSVAKPGRVAARVGTGLAGVGSRIGLLKK